MEPTTIVENEFTKFNQHVTTQPDGPGLRIGKRGELTMVGNFTPGGAELFRKRLPQFQAEAGYYEGRVGSIQDFRIIVFDNDTRYILSLVYDGDFKPYLQDIATYAGEWLDGLADGVLEDYPGIHSQHFAKWVLDRFIQADFFFVGAPDSSVRDIQKMEKLTRAWNDLLDAAN
ncbi:hypothetical protein [Chitinophaga tropicalis]|uniref:Uncharacterized protein n=1 Tax=Chitinophaga tropicalis TaxID=2683588 RepID=A0A7K1U4Z3_9BACT|nr:hypothetical protein [Chitinophaga tropicalis]MVT09434.1 hypothetical protein [Chitinophaga tropicalis]